MFITRVGWALALLVSLSGCATWSGHGVTTSPPQKLRIAVLPVRDDVVIKKLSDIETPSKAPASGPDENELIRQKMQAVTDDVTHFIEMRLKASPYFEVVPRNRLTQRWRL